MKPNDIPFYYDNHALARDLRDMLIEHMDGIMIPLSSIGPKTRRNRIFKLLVTKKLLRMVPTEMPRHSVITDEGWRQLGVMLADYADALLRVALIEQRHFPLHQDFRHLSAIPAKFGSFSKIEV
jgi:hypothetical protein